MSELLDKTGSSVGRNDPCPCGSGRKFKRCHGMEETVAQAPALSASSESAANAEGANPMNGMGPMGGFDPSKVDPKVMSQMQSLLQRLPRNQLMRLQSIMQRMMAGQDVTAEAMELQKSMPPEFLELSMQIQMQQMGMSAPEAEKELTEEEAKRIIAEAAESGRISDVKAKSLIGEDPKEVLERKEEGGAKGFFKGLLGKK